MLMPVLTVVMVQGKTENDNNAVNARHHAAACVIG